MTYITFDVMHNFIFTLHHERILKANNLINHEFLSTNMFVHNVMRKTICKQTCSGVDRYNTYMFLRSFISILLSTVLIFES